MQLVGKDADAAGLLPAAAQAGVVVKRPDYAPPLAGSPPSMAIVGKKHRYDVYLSA